MPLRRKLLIPILAVIVLLCRASFARAQAGPLDVSYCDLAQHPGTFDGKMLRVRGTLSVHFEDFSLVAPDCEADQYIWLAFGGDVPGIVTSMVKDIDRTPGADVTLNGQPFAIKKDENFLKLYALITARKRDKPAYSVTATLSGIFAAGRETTGGDGKVRYTGYGHLGCCSLFLITEVGPNIQSTPPAKLTLSGTVLGPDAKPINGIVVLDDIQGGEPPVRQQATTDEKGRFAFPISGQLLRIENPSYRPLAISIEPGGTPLRIKLEDAKRSDWHVSPCSPGSTAQRVGFSVLYALPLDMESSLFDDDPRSYFVFPHGGSRDDAELIISKSIARPSPNDSASGGEQRWIRDMAGAIIGIDARGVGRPGGPWRVAHFHDREYVSYSWLHGRSRGPLDKVIDSACVADQ